MSLLIFGGLLLAIALSLVVFYRVKVHELRQRRQNPSQGFNRTRFLVLLGVVVLLLAVSVLLGIVDNGH